MASQDAHEQLARETQWVAELLAEASEYRWAIIASFYAALHYASALLAGPPINIETDFLEKHSQRNRLIRRSLPEVWKDYDPLIGQSVKARYVPRATVDAAAYRSARDRLRRIKDYWQQYRTDI